MSKKKSKLEKTLVEKILDRDKVPYRQAEFATHKDSGGVAKMDTSILNENEHLVYKTLVCSGNKTGPLVGVVPVTEHLSMKKLAKNSGNKKCEMLPLKKLEKTTGYVHGANTPIGIYFNHHFPIYLDAGMKNEEEVGVSSGKVGRSVFIKPADLQKVTHATFCDLLE
ncbi:aminoacyl-tRNA deacylase [Lactobacillus acetotolerans]|jgi:Cys-tRNA(Pro)/Cys-tRNA(Cys) deacylase|uniref:Cys-tRNA(Pro)/Cys-tRNA(Cys) deacylase n=2 Tax=Lactobacillus acetotolerans TaxID=1600 RepID=A0A0D6A3B4_9LACO|nr:aminoacyl-tRNA deacylase [Lactobacillus acetotolerans]KRN40956.1 transcriptional regulator [Lactobacillus acetotolerans DSM 20749 = JCM 3825]QFG51249.1 aminoacyl-tRNA deacylase [Lactobacillus acetotolerans]QJD73546.1 aminoacyl-tRNA deacylase [Lactobacillus acetotolerans]BAQ57216.1 transcriptional regulator [Lactobacillus acetotolerans]GGV13971.1 Cys-tRNA(Pro)/Cys-tRNA(Cys) deacylase [Lactobacillus acetotolerans DSM 20749 = JCM 3825]